MICKSKPLRTKKNNEIYSNSLCFVIFFSQQHFNTNPNEYWLLSGAMSAFWLVMVACLSAGDCGAAKATAKRAAKTITNFILKCLIFLIYPREELKCV